MGACGDDCRGIAVLKWPVPAPIEGVKSRKRVLFDVKEVQLQGAHSGISASGLRLSQESRIAAIGEAGQAAVSLLSGKAEVAGAWVVHPSLRAVHLAPGVLADGAEEVDYMEAVDAALQTRPHVVVLDEEASRSDPRWAKTFSTILRSEGLGRFRGAVVVCVADERRALGLPCSECWAGLGPDQRRAGQRPLHELDGAMRMPLGMPAP